MPELIELTNADRAFYTTLGPYLANRDVIKTVGGPIWDDDTKTWFALKDKKHGVMGFAAVAVHGNRTTIESLYIADPTWRRIATELVGVIVSRYGKTDLHAVVRHDIAYAYTSNGFTQTSTTKEFAKLTRKAS